MLLSICYNMNTNILKEYKHNIFTKKEKKKNTKCYKKEINKIFKILLCNHVISLQ